MVLFFLYCRCPSFYGRSSGHFAIFFSSRVLPENFCRVLFSPVLDFPFRFFSALPSSIVLALGFLDLGLLFCFFCFGGRSKVVGGKKLCFFGSCGRNSCYQSTVVVWGFFPGGKVSICRFLWGPLRVCSGSILFFYTIARPSEVLLLLFIFDCCLVGVV